ncbi:MAG: class I SAM-dependent rRNA methyltransferase [Lachnospiraceae bacterium]|nr:class I SAM-dependent rRNA methyltransferase [Lachnospiraceae bacterium]
MNQGVITLRKGEGRLLKAGGAWIFDNEVDAVSGAPQDGDIVQVRDFDGYPMGQGLYNSASKIRVRMLTRSADRAVGEDFWRMRLQNAWNYRKDTVDTSSCRVVFGEADFLPGLTVDKYEDVLVFEALSLGIDRQKEMLLGLLKEVLAADGVRIRGVFERSDSRERRKEGLAPVKGFLGEPFDTNVEITENGVKYLVDVKDGQKTGFFLDQKYNRLAIQRLCRGRRVLDCFTHMGTFALNAGLAGASEVLGLDISEYAVEQARANAVRNGLEETVKFRAADVFDELPRLEAAGERYDVVILDPPAFTKSRATVKSAEKGYREINRKGLALVRDGGYLATCSCSHFMDAENFARVIAQAARSAHRRLRQVEYRTQAPDHPVLWAADESFYLKFYIFQVCEEK